MLVIAPFVSVIAHSGEHIEQASEPSDLLTTLGHQSVFVSLIICIVMLLTTYGLLSLTPIKPLQRILALVPITILLGIFYMQHQPVVSSIILSLGFIVSFVLAFGMLKAGK